MSAPITAAVVPPSTSGLEGMSRKKGETLEAEKTRLKRATEEFEAFFTNQMLKTMRQTIPKPDDGKNNAFSNDLGKDTWTEMFDMEVARSMSNTGGRSIADVLYQSLERLVDAEFGVDAPSGIKPLKSEQEVIKLKREVLDLPTVDHVKDLPSKQLFNIKNISHKQSIKQDPILLKYGHLIEEAAQVTKLDSALIASVIQVESAGQSRAVSPAGAKGLMQLIDSTAKEQGVTDSFDPKQNIMGGSRYLKKMITRFGNVELGLAAYNAGPGNVNKYGGMPPFDETKNYVKRVTSEMSVRSAK